MLADVHEENSATHRYLISKGEISLIAFSDHFYVLLWYLCSSLVLYQNVTSNYLLRVNRNVKSEIYISEFFVQLD